MTTPSSRSVLSVLTKSRLEDLGRQLGLVLPMDGKKDELVSALAASGQAPFAELLRTLGRDELKTACRAHGLDDTGRARPLLAGRLLEAHGVDAAPPAPLFSAHDIPRYAPHPGDIVQVRHRQWLVEEVAPPPAEKHATAVRMVCLDDDNQGRVLEVLWELELGAKVLQPEAHGLGEVRAIDAPRQFGAYLHALKWSSVTATDARLFQRRFRSPRGAGLREAAERPPAGVETGTINASRCLGRHHPLPPIAIHYRRSGYSSWRTSEVAEGCSTRLRLRRDSLAGTTSRARRSHGTRHGLRCG
jgi:hypothetical protein